jgi:hypothetical protein
MSLLGHLTLSQWSQEIIRANFEPIFQTVIYTRTFKQAYAKEINLVVLKLCKFAGEDINSSKVARILTCTMSSVNGLVSVCNMSALAPPDICPSKLYMATIALVK